MLQKLRNGNVERLVRTRNNAMDNEIGELRDKLQIISTDTWDVSDSLDKFTDISALLMVRSY